MYYSITICPNLVPNSLHLPLLSHGHQGHWPRWPPKLPPTAASLPSLSSWGKESVLASRMCGEATPASAQMARLRTQTPSLCHFLAFNYNYLYFKISICAQVEHLDLAQYNADYPFSVFSFILPDFAVLVSSEPPTALCTITSPSEIYKSNSSTGFTDSAMKQVS